MVGAISGSSAAQQLYSSMQASAVKNTQSGKASYAAYEEATESSAEKQAELDKGEIIDTYA